LDRADQAAIEGVDIHRHAGRWACTYAISPCSASIGAARGWRDSTQCHPDHRRSNIHGFAGCHGYNRARQRFLRQRDGHQRNFRHTRGVQSGGNQTDRRTQALRATRVAYDGLPWLTPLTKCVRRSLLGGGEKPRANAAACSGGSTQSVKPLRGKSMSGLKLLSINSTLSGTPVANAPPARLGRSRVPDEPPRSALNRSRAGTDEKTNKHPVDRRRPDGAPGTRPGPRRGEL